MNGKTWMLYGATGYTGQLIAREAVRRGSRPLLAGRDEDKVRRLAEALGLEGIALAIDDSQALARAVASVDLLLNAAGPFAHTCLPLMEACLAGNTHYLDISNEIPVFEAARARDGRARESGITLMPGVGFGVVASNCLVRRVCEQIAEPVTLEVGIVPYVAQTSAGAARSTLEVIGQGGRVRRGGALVRVPLGHGARRIVFPDGARNMIPIPSGDLEAAQLMAARMAAGHQPSDITVYAPVPLPPFAARLVLPVAQALLSSGWLRGQIGDRLERRGVTSKQTPPSTGQRSQLWARASDRAGNCAEGWLEAGEGYAFTAAASVLAVERVLGGCPAGLLPPAALGADIAVQAGGVWRDLTTGSACPEAG